MRLNKIYIVYLTFILSYVLISIKLNKKLNLTSSYLNAFLYSIGLSWVFYINNLKYILNNEVNYTSSLWNYVNILNNNNLNIFLFSILLINISLFWLKYKLWTKINLVLLLFFLNNVETSIFKIQTNFGYDIIINSSLFNGILLIHPLCTYLTYIYALNFFILFFLKKKQKKFIVFFIKKGLRKMGIFSLSALFLGAYWAQQEINWGGWWNWDFVELISLIFFITSFSIIHINMNRNYNLILILTKNLILFVSLFFFIVRLDILNSIHAFNSFFLKKNYIKLVNLLILMIFIKLYIHKLSIFKKFFFNKNYNIIYLLMSILNTILIIYMLLNLFYSYILNNQYLEVTKNIKYIYIYIIFIFSLIIINKKIILYIVYINILIINNVWLIFYYLLIFYKKLINNKKLIIIHNTIYYIVLCIIINNYNIIINNIIINNYIINNYNKIIINNNLISTDYFLNIDFLLKNLYLKSNQLILNYFDNYFISNIFINTNTKIVNIYYNLIDTLIFAGLFKIFFFFFFFHIWFYHLIINNFKKKINNFINFNIFIK